MAFEMSGATLAGLKAGADLSGQQFRFVKLDGSGDVVLCGDGERALGVLVNEPGLGEACTIYGPGSVAKVNASAAIAIGAAVASDASGDGATAATTEYIQGIALTSAANANEVISVWLTFPGRLA